MPDVAQKQIDLRESQYPETLAILDYWNDRRGSRFAPAWADIDLMDLPMPLIPRVVVVDVLERPLDFKYRFWGSWHVEFHGYDQTNKLVSELMPPAYGELIANQYKHTIEARDPLLFVQQIPVKSGLWYFTELIRFPLSDDGEKVSKILSAESSGGDTHEAQKYFTHMA